MKGEDVSIHPIHKSLEVTISMEATSLRMFALQLAAGLITAIRNYPTEAYGVPSAGPGGVLSERINWAPHGYHNALQSHASFLYAVVKTLVEIEDTHLHTFVLFDGQPAAQLIADALCAYQAWKEQVCEKQRELHGPHWGSATGFFRADWTDLNEKLLRTVRQ